ncbi:MAG: methionyl-tRNA formyltransferase [Candidatus Azosocius agrarius]|nr:MAG: methionyl-tRNA formyltransferase [Gammaproteobacteria bacterium]
MNNIIFAGFSIFSYIILKNLLKNNIKITAVIYPKKNNTIDNIDSKYSIIKLATMYKINTHQIENLSDNNIVNLIKNLTPSLIIVASYGNIFPSKILEIPLIGCINIHASLLPKWRGASPIQQAILNNNKYTGITIIIMNKNIDEGTLIYKKICPIKYCNTNFQLNIKLAYIASKMILKNINNLLNKNFTKFIQNTNLVSYAHKIKKFDGIINWKNSAIKITKQLQAYYNWPFIFTYLKKNYIQIIEATIFINSILYKYGQIIKKHKNGIYISTNKNIIIIKKYKIEGKKTINTKILNDTNKLILGFFFINT